MNINISQMKRFVKWMNCKTTEINFIYIKLKFFL